VTKAKTFIADATLKEAPQEIVCFERGIGHGCDGVIVSFHEDYSSYVRLKERIREYPIVEFSETESFLINLDDKIHYRHLTLTTLAQHMLTLKKRNNE